MSIQSQYTFRLTPEVQAIVERIKAPTRWKRSEVLRGLVERGITQYMKDGEIFEPNWVPDKTPKDILIKLEGRLRTGSLSLFKSTKHKASE